MFLDSPWSQLPRATARRRQRFFGTNTPVRSTAVTNSVKRDRNVNEACVIVLRLLLVSQLAWWELRKTLSQ